MHTEVDTKLYTILSHTLRTFHTHYYRILFTYDIAIYTVLTQVNSRAFKSPCTMQSRKRTITYTHIIHKDKAHTHFPFSFCPGAKLVLDGFDIISNEKQTRQNI